MGAEAGGLKYLSMSRRYDPNLETFAWTSLTLWWAGLASQHVAIRIDGPIGGLLFASTTIATASAWTLLQPVWLWLVAADAARRPQARPTKEREPRHDPRSRSRVVALTFAASIAVAALAHFVGKVLKSLGFAAQWTAATDQEWTALGENAQAAANGEAVLGIMVGIGIGTRLPRWLMERRFRREQAALEPPRR